MWETLTTLFTSKRALIAVLIALFDLLLLLGADIDPALAETIATLVTVVAGILIAGISHSDHGKAMGQPAGTDHKGRGTPTEIAADHTTPIDE